MAYLTGEQFLARYDRRQVARLVSDTGTPAASAGLDGDAVLAACLEDAAGMILLAARVGQRYTAAHLAAVAASADEAVAGQLRRLNADLAMGLLARRRLLPEDEVRRMVPAYGEALSALELLRRGERVFDSEDQAEAGSAVENITPLNEEWELLSQQLRYFGLNPNTSDP